MADDSILLNLATEAGGKEIATVNQGGFQHEKVVAEFLVAGVPQTVDSGNPLPVTDAAAEVSLAAINIDTSAIAGAVSGTEMQVDVLSIAAGTNYIGKTRLTDGTTDAEVVPLTGYNAQAVAIVDGSGNQIESFGSTTVVNAISSAAFALGSAAYSQTSAIATDYILNHIQLNFSTALSRDITITAANGTILWSDTANTATNIVLENINIAFNGNDNFTIAITQTAGACALDVLATILQGSVTLAGTSVDVTSIAAGDNNIGNVDVVTMPITEVVGSIAHDSADSGKPLKVGMKAISFGANPTAVAANDRTDWYANLAGIPFVLGGHPNIICLRAASAGAQTDVALVSVSGGSKIVVTRVTVTASAANTVNPSVIIGFGAANTPTTTGVVLSHPAVSPGSGVVEGNGAGILGVGADGEDLRITNSAPTGGSIDVVVSYFTITS